MAVFLKIKNVLQKRKETRRRASRATNRNHGQACLSVGTPGAESKGVDDCCTPLTVHFVQSLSFSKDFDTLRGVSGKTMRPMQSAKVKENGA